LLWLENLLLSSKEVSIGAERGDPSKRGYPRLGPAVRQARHMNNPVRKYLIKPWNGDKGVDTHNNEDRNIHPAVKQRAPLHQDYSGSL
jgi:hypothetical protein